MFVQSINSLGGKFDNLREFCFKTEVGYPMHR